MLVAQLLKGAVRHAGSSGQSSITAVRGVSSSSHRFAAFGRTPPPSCPDTDHPKILITGWFSNRVIACAMFFLFLRQLFSPSLSLSLSF